MSGLGKFQLSLDLVTIEDWTLKFLVEVDFENFCSS